MKKTLKIKDWHICLYSQVDGGEMAEINKKLSALNVSDSVKVQAFENLSHSNRGSTIANSTQHRILALISNQTDKSQMLNTLTHEVRHIVDIICSECMEEDAAYLSGEIMARLADWV